MTDKQIIANLTAKLEAATKPKWVSVHDMTPPNGTGVICCCSSGHVSEMYFRDDKFDFPYSNHEPDEYDLQFLWGITHWQPLPEPFEAK